MAEGNIQEQLSPKSRAIIGRELDLADERHSEIVTIYCEDLRILLGEAETSSPQTALPLAAVLKPVEEARAILERLNDADYKYSKSARVIKLSEIRTILAALATLQGEVGGTKEAPQGTGAQLDEENR